MITHSSKARNIGMHICNIRKRLLIDAEVVAEQVCIHVDDLFAMEKGEIPVPFSVVLKFAKLTHLEPHLFYQREVGNG